MITGRTTLPANSLSVGSGIKALREFRVLFTGQLLEYRAFLAFYLFFETVAPLAIVYAFGHYSGTTPQASSLLYIISGAITFNLTNLGLMSIASQLSFMRYNGTLVYYYSLPITKLSFIAALLGTQLVVALPSLLVPVLAGSWMYDLNLYLNMWFGVVVLLGGLLLATLGTFLGMSIKQPAVVRLVINTLIFVVTLASPAFIPEALLPLPLQWLGWVLPTTYISGAINHCFRGLYDTTFFMDLLILILMNVAALLATLKLWVWRAE